MTYAAEKVVEFIGNFKSIQNEVLKYFDGDMTDLRSKENGITYQLRLFTEEVSICEVNTNFSLQNYISGYPVIDQSDEEKDHHEILAVIKVQRKLYLFQLQDMDSDIDNELYYNFDNLLFEE